MNYPRGYLWFIIHVSEKDEKCPLTTLILIDNRDDYIDKQMLTERCVNPLVEGRIFFWQVHRQEQVTLDLSNKSFIHHRHIVLILTMARFRNHLQMLKLCVSHPTILPKEKVLLFKVSLQICCIRTWVEVVLEGNRVVEQPLSYDWKPGYITFNGRANGNNGQIYDFFLIG